MNRDKRAVIIQEIQYWRKNKLLPEQYCDFLLNLYGGAETEISATGRANKSILNNSKGLAWSLGLGLISIISILVINFNAFPLQLQIAVAIIGVLILFVLGMRIIKRSVPLAYATIGAGCLLMLAAGEWLLMQNGWNDAAAAIGYLTFCCLVWLFIGLLLNLSFLHFCGWAGLMLVYGWLISQFVTPVYDYRLHLAWILPTVLFIAIGWLIRNRSRAVTRVVWLAAALAWLSPELQTIILAEGSSIIAQAVLVGKIMITGTVLYSVRKYWVEWVAA